MPVLNEDFYILEKRDIPKASITLADAFQFDTIWRLFFREEATLEQKSMLFQTPLKYSYKFGKVYATSDNFEGVSCSVPGELADLTVWRVLLSGGFFNSVKAMRACTKLALKQAKIFKPLEEDRKTNMKGKDYLYLMVLGVAPAYQRQGFGSRLVDQLIKESDQKKIPIYTETQTEGNVRFYEKLGFRQIKQIMMPIINLPQWELIREPDT